MPPIAHADVQIRFLSSFREPILGRQKTQTRRPIKVDSWPRSAGGGAFVDGLWYWRNGWDGSLIAPIDCQPSLLIGQRFDAVDPAGEKFAECKVIDIRVERLSQTSEADAKASGVPGGCLNCGTPACEDGKPCDKPSRSYIDSFVWMWRSIYGEGRHSWEQNPWVWVYEFELVEAAE